MSRGCVWLLLALVGVASHAAAAQPASCPAGVAQSSRIFGYTTTYHDTAGDLCTTTFRTLEEAESAIHHDPNDTGYQAAGMAFAVANNFFSNPGGVAELDYRPHGAAKSNSAILQGPAASVQTSYSMQTAGWPPTAATVASACQAKLQACSGSPAGWCNSEADNKALAQCQFDQTYHSNPNFCWIRSGDASLVGSIPAFTSVSVSSSNSGQGAFHYEAASSTDPNWGATLDITANACSTSAGTSASPAGDGDATTTNTSQSRTFTWNRSRQDNFTCEQGDTVNTGASGSGDACHSNFYKLFIDAPSFQQDDQCGVGDPCVPGSGNQATSAPGFTYGNIALDLYYNSLRQLKPVASIDRNWSHSYARRILTPWNQDHVTDPAQGGPVYLESERTQLEIYTLIDPSVPNVYRSTHHVGDILRYFTPSAGQAPVWQLTHEGGKTEVYDRAGRLIGIESPDDPRQDITISYLLPGTLDDPNTTIGNDTDHLQETFWRIAQITDGTGRFVTFHYTDPRYYWLDHIDGDDGQPLLRFGYDAQHRLQTLTYRGEQDPSNGLSRQFLYNEAGNIGPDIPAGVTGYWLTGVLDANGARYSTFKFDDWGRAIASWHGTNAEKVTVAYPADASGNPIDSTATATMPNGSVRTFSYGTTPTPYRRPTSVQEQSTDNPSGEVNTASTYDPTTGRLTSSQNSRGVVTKYFYAPSGSDQSVHETSRIEAWNTAQQRRVETDWDALLNRVTATRTYADPSDPNNTSAGTLVAETTYTYDPSTGQLATRTEHDAQSGALRTWTFTYCQSVDPTGGCPIVGLLHSTDGPRTDVSDITTYAYYASTDLSGCAATTGIPCHHQGDLQRVTDVLGHTVQYLSYTPRGQVGRTQDANGTDTDYHYNGRGWLTDRIVRAAADGTPNAADAITHMDYDHVGNVTKITQPDGATLAYTYDAAHRLTKITDNLGDVIDYCPGGPNSSECLDSDGHRRVEQTRDPNGNITRAVHHVYDQLGHLKQTLNAANQSIFDATDGYDGNGNLTHSVDGRGTTTEQHYDPLDRLMTTLQDVGGTDPDTANATTGYTYNARDQIHTVTDPSNLTTTYTYDGLGNLTGLTSPDTGTTSYHYDAAGNRTQHIDARNVESDDSYDALNRLTTIHYPAHSALDVTYTYDQTPSACTSTYPVGHIATMTDASGSTTYCYDRRGNVTAKQQITHGERLDTDYQWNLADRLTGVTYPSGAQVSYTRDADGRIQSLSVTPHGGSATPVVSNITWLPFGPATSYTFASGNQTLSKTFDQNEWATAVTSNALNLHFCHDTIGNITQLAASSPACQATPTETYTYDKLNRLTGVENTANSPLQTFTYNVTGDRTSKTLAGQPEQAYAYGSSTHHLTSVDANPRSFDANGNTTGITDSATTDFSFDARNRLTEVSRNRAQVASYDYNGKGERVYKDTIAPTSTTTRFSYNENGTLLGQYTDTSARETLWVNATPVAILTTSGQSLPDADTIFANGFESGPTISSALNYIHTDQLGTPRAVTDTTGTVVWRWPWANNAFGDSPAQTDPGGTGSNFSFNLRYPGQYADAESGLHYNYFRDYEPGTGRYVESDPIGLTGGITTYGYVLENSLDASDPLGLRTCKGIWVQISWERVFNIRCHCIWLCESCDHKDMWSGNSHDPSLPRTSGFVYFNPGKVGHDYDAESGNDCACSHKPGPETGCKSCRK